MTAPSKLPDTQVTITDVRAAAQRLFDAGKIEDASLLMEYAARLEDATRKREPDERAA